MLFFFFWKKFNFLFYCCYFFRKILILMLVYNTRVEFMNLFYVFGFFKLGFCSVVVSFSDFVIDFGLVDYVDLFKFICYLYYL